MTVRERYNAPFEEQDQNEVNELMSKMQAGVGKGKSRKGNFSCRKSDYKVDNSNLVVTSWKFQDWDYKQKQLPTNARGLFTYRHSNGNHEIVIRGYDKFFNTGEVPRTRWEWIKAHTQGPYDVTMKENGCIIFISGLPDGTLLVCSKHSTGSRGDPEKSHSMVGDKWINRQLERIGKTREDFAKFLRNANVTAVAELCDDSFEEHILEYTGEMAGLYLHGVNLNLPVFATWPSAQVRAFADDWGFKNIETIEKDNVDELKTFLEGVAETGEWNGRAVEGFVIRCKARFGADDRNWHDWFFKYKFEEPYLMYRGWREVTKQIIAGHEPRFKKHVAITNQYIVYAREQLRQNPGIGKAFMMNHGIIAMRDGFLASKGLSGHDIIKREEEAGETKARSIVLVPIATLGCGKTTVALGLVKLFDCGHVQNDNITVKKGKPAAFARNIAVELNNHPIVIADRNNHQKREREQLIQDVSAINRDVKFVALHYVHHHPGDEGLYSKIREVTRKRIFDRGDNHQTIHSGVGDSNTIIGIMEGFLSRFQPLDADTEPDCRFDNVIDLDPLADSRENLETVVGQLHELYPHLLGEDMPSTGDLDEAIEFALSEYKPDVKHTINRGGSGNGPRVVEAAGPSDAGSSRQGNNRNARNSPAPGKGKEKQPAVEYFAVNLPAAMVTAAIDQAFSSQPAEIRQFHTQLKSTRRIQPAFHITMAHRANVKRQPELWDHYNKLHQALAPGETAMDKLQVKMEKVVWDGRVMAIVASLVDSKGHECGNEVMHITVGTADERIKPRESNELLMRWQERQDDLAGMGIRELALGKDGGGVVLYGNLAAVMARR
ncbi:tRNA ligase [Drechslerella dactyloides]|uniref:tRNA ligase n=1 Tax=Drechslerella dactyloides TaxID=74499 RepID=A0AAD6NJI4_DREDA|nr:tRNA ligase [Drechslerella dactyloides]